MRRFLSIMLSKLTIISILLLTACSEQESNESTNMPNSTLLENFRQEPKFEPDEFYTGPDAPEDAPALNALVNDTIDEISAMPQPLDRDGVRNRLKKLVNDVDLFATEDRDQTYRYAVRIWRAAGFTEESKLLGVPDDRILMVP